MRLFGQAERLNSAGKKAAKDGSEAKAPTGDKKALRSVRAESCCKIMSTARGMDVGDWSDLEGSDVETSDARGVEDERCPRG